VYVATGNAADPRKVARIEADGVRALRVGGGARAEGGRLIEELAKEEHRTIAMLGGGEVLHSLVVDDVLDRLYLTLACRMLGGLPFDTLLTGPVLEPAARFRLAALHYDAAGAAAGTAAGAAADAAASDADVEQLFAVLDRSHALKDSMSLRGIVNSGDDPPHIVRAVDDLSGRSYEQCPSIDPRRPHLNARYNSPTARSTSPGLE
jgi:hypothetical protein